MGLDIFIQHKILLKIPTSCFKDNFNFAPHAYNLFMSHSGQLDYQ